jgi:endonuclease/exonuclease/phosphatase family metal-dependent hydrolase
LVLLLPSAAWSSKNDGPRLPESSPTDTSGPDQLSFEELVELARSARPAGALAVKLERLLTTPFIGRPPKPSQVPRRPSAQTLGPFIRACLWNIERGSEFHWIRDALSSPESFRARLAESKPDLPLNPLVEQQLELLRGADILILNEVDLGITRTEYRDVARDLAEILGMDYAFGVEFVEVDKLDLGLEDVTLEDKEMELEIERDLAPDRERYRGLHGTAVLSRYPILRADILRLKICYDWNLAEREAISALEQGRRWSAARFFLERIAREVRHGGRMALRVDLEVPELASGGLTVVAPHLENKCAPRCRRDQMNEVLRWIRDVENPVVLAGDLNTTGSDAAPTSVGREIRKRVRNPKFWAQRFIDWLNPVSIPRSLLLPTAYFRSYLDPTARHIPFLLPNRERGLFRELEAFRFRDGGAFDFRGSPERTINGSARTLANSNHRDRKGFKSTFALQRDYGGLVGRFKLDWILVKPFLRHPRDSKGSYRLAPHFPVTLEELNESAPGRISDHSPLTVDLPLTEPR